MTGKTWQLQEAKQHLSEVVRCAEEDGAQHISVHGDDAVVVLEAEDYQQPTKGKWFGRRPGESMYEWLKRGGVMRPIGDELYDVLNAERGPHDMVPKTTIFDE